MSAMRTTLTNIAQILLVFFLLPFFALICGAFNDSSLTTGLINFLGQVPLCQTLADIVSTQLSSTTSQTDLMEITLWTFFKEFPSAIIAGISVHLCVGIFDHIWFNFPKHLKPLPILPGFFGIVLFTIISNVIGLTGSDLTAFFVEAGVVVVMLIGLWILLKAGWGKKVSIKTALLWIIEGLYAVLLTTYISGMMLIMQDEEPINAFSLILLLAVAAIIGSLLVYFVRIGVDRDERG